MEDIKRPIWTPMHVEELEREFPEITNESDMNKILINIGKRTVVKFYRDKVKAIEARNKRNATKGL